MATEQHSIKHKGTQYPVVVYEDISGGYWVNCPAFEGCYSQGDTIDEALKNVKQAIALCLEERSPSFSPKTSEVSLHFVRV